jgi:hypothetical protein
MGGFNDLDKFADDVKEAGRNVKEKVKEEYDEIKNG